MRRELQIIYLVPRTENKKLHPTNCKSRYDRILPSNRNRKERHPLEQGGSKGFGASFQPALGNAEMDVRREMRSNAPSPRSSPLPAR